MTARKIASALGICLLFAGVISAQETIHVLKKGETLYSLSRSYGVTYSSILARNKISDANKVRAGQKIVIPSASGSDSARSSSTVASTTASDSSSAKPDSVPAKHTVAKGETLFSIARRYDLTVSELRSLNKLSDKSVLKSGDVLVVRQQKVASSAVPDAPAAVFSSSSASDKASPKNEDPRPVTAKRNDPSVKWPVHAKELAYMEGKLYGVLLIGERAERVQSLSAGTVVSAEAYRGFGRVAIVQAPDGHVYVYGGNESLSVKAGDRIASGTELGRLGVDSLTGKPSLFFFVYKDNIAIDPAKAPRS